MTLVRPLVVLMAAAALGGCAIAPTAPPASDAPLAAQCEAYFAALDRIVGAAGVRDAEAARVAGFPYLRVDRFLASFRDEVDEEQFARWVDALRRLDREGRAVEHANLPPAERATLREAVRRTGLPDAEPAALTEGCGDTLAARDLASPSRRQALRGAAIVPDDYAAWKRVVGLYPLTRILFAAGVREYEAGVHAVFAHPLEALPVHGRAVRYAPPPSSLDPTEARTLARRVARAGAAFEPPVPADVERLLLLHAPVLEVDEALPEDRIGALRIDATGAAVVDTSAAVVYGRVVFTRLNERVLPQAVYGVWFPGRPRTSAFDLLGGEFDAVVWRATLDEDGVPLLYDTMHACGCYHWFFPTRRASLRPRPGGLDEWALVPQPAPDLASGERIGLRIASRSHYIERVRADGGTGRGYALTPESDLRSLPAPGGTRRSLYGPDGIVAGSERGERYFFWPMGIAEPGAMRQWGRHATAFVGRRHFDDADLLARYFRFADPR